MNDTLPALRHAVRGCLNSIKLCISALELPCTREEEQEFINDVILSADKMMHLTEQLEAYFDAAPTVSPQQI